MTFLVLLIQFVVSTMLPHLPQGMVKGATVQASILPRQHFPAIPGRPIVTPPDAATAPAVSAQAAGVWDVAANVPLYEKNSAAQRPLASVTKLMSALVVLEANPNLEATVTIAQGDNDPEGSRMRIATGAVVTVRDLLYGTLVESGNNSAEALVRATGFLEGDFVGRMNARAAELGMAQTHFTDVTGLGPNNVSTVRDLLWLTRVAFRQPLIRQISTTQKYDVKDQTSGKVLTIQNTDLLLGRDLTVVAGKTGWSDFSGSNLVTEFTDGKGHNLISIVLGSEGTNGRFTDTETLVRWAFANTDWRMP